MTPQERMAICKKCVFLKKFDRCEKCGCLMQIKTKIPSMSCPIDKW